MDKSHELYRVKWKISFLFLSPSLAVPLLKDNQCYWFLMDSSVTSSNNFWKEVGVIFTGQLSHWVKQHYFEGKLAIELVVREEKPEIHFTNEKIEAWRIKKRSSNVAEGTSILNTGHVIPSVMLSFNTMWNWIKPLQIYQNLKLNHYLKLSLYHWPLPWAIKADQIKAVKLESLF